MIRIDFNKKLLYCFSGNLRGCKFPPTFISYTFLISSLIFPKLSSKLTIIQNSNLHQNLHFFCEMQINAQNLHFLCKKRELMPKFHVTAQKCELVPKIYIWIRSLFPQDSLVKICIFWHTCISVWYFLITLDLKLWLT